MKMKKTSFFYLFYLMSLIFLNYEKKKEENELREDGIMKLFKKNY